MAQLLQKARTASLQEGSALSRTDVEDELGSLGVNANVIAALPLDTLVSLREGICKLLNASERKKAGRPKGTGQLITDLTPLDKQILLTLLRSGGNITSLGLSKELAAPLSTVQRRRQRLEENLLEQSYSLKVDKLGCGIAMVFVSTNSGTISSVGEEILKMDDMVTLVTRMVGESAMDLKVDVLFKSRAQLLSLLERIRSINGVKSIVWSEPVQVLGRSNKCYETMIDSI